MTVVLTADLVAVAVVAAARSYGDCPEDALTARSGVLRRSLSAAISALARLEVAPMGRLSRILKVGSSTVPAARHARTEGFVAAEARALDAVRAALVDMALAEAGERPVAHVGAGEAEAPATACGGSPQIAGEVEGVELPAPVVTPKPPPARGGVRPARILSAGKVRAEVLACLGDEPSTGPELVQLVGVGEGAIREALSGLKDAGAVTCTAMTAEGWKAQTWSLAGGAER